MTGAKPLAATPPVRHDAYVALRHRDFRWYIFSTFTMTLGSQLQAVVVGWQVYTITHDPLSLGLIGLAEALPFIAVALPAGYVADRFNRRSVSVFALFVLALCSVALLVFSAGGGRSCLVWRVADLCRDLHERNRPQPASARAAGTRRGDRAAYRVGECHRLAEQHLADRGRCRAGDWRAAVRIQRCGRVVQRWTPSSWCWRCWG